MVMGGQRARSPGEGVENSELSDTSGCNRLDPTRAHRALATGRAARRASAGARELTQAGTREVLSMMRRCSVGATIASSQVFATRRRCTGAAPAQR
jgi:hypothetical protein